MPQAEQSLLKPTPIEAFFNRTLGSLAAIGLGPKGYYLLEVGGRKSGHLFVTPVCIVDQAGHRYVVPPRGTTQWVRNARATGRIALRSGSDRDSFEAREVTVG